MVGDRLGVVVSELVPDDMDPQQETPKAQGAKASDLASGDLDMAVFSAPWFRIRMSEFKLRCDAVCGCRVTCGRGWLITSVELPASRV